MFFPAHGVEEGVDRGGDQGGEEVFHGVELEFDVVDPGFPDVVNGEPAEDEVDCVADVPSDEGIVEIWHDCLLYGWPAAFSGDR